MTIWTPALDDSGPRYIAIADALRRDMETGRLSAGDRLPTHRELARALGVTVGTVSRGYAEAERRGLTVGEVGRGTYVRGTTSKQAWHDAPASREASGEPMDLTLSLPVSLPEEREMLASTLRELAADPGVAGLLDYRQESGSQRQRAVGANWLSRLDLQISADDLLVTAGSQHGLNVVLSSLFSPGQTLLAESLTYPSIKSQARALGLRLRGVVLDEQGALPASIDEACSRDPKPSAIYLVPTLQNPTVATMSERRRREIVAVAEKHDLWIIEDDVHAFMPSEPALPLAALAPERTIYLASVAKCLAPGLRTGYLAAPQTLRSRLLAGIHNTLWMPPPLTVELTTRWLEDGTAEALIAAKRRATADRQRLAKRLLDLEGVALRSDPSSYHLWLELPDPWCADDLVSQARERGVHALSAGVFAIGRHQVPHALRLSIGVPALADLERALEILAELINGGGAPVY